VADGKEDVIQIVFMDVKKGSGMLTRTQRLINRAADKKSVTWKALRIAVCSKYGGI